MSIKLRGKKVAVEKISKSSSGPGGSLFALPEDTTSCGVIVYLGDQLETTARIELKVGMKVYFGDKRQQVRIEGKDLQVMEEDNVLAVALD